jgi:hypothetical protein
MSFKGVGLILLVFLFSGCASLEEPRWVLLGDTQEKGFFLDREQVERQTNGNYLYTVKSSHYQEGKPHLIDETRDTNGVLFVEMNCQERQWKKLWSGSMDQDGKILFRRPSLSPASQPITSDPIHFSAYNYLCGKTNQVIQHNH